MKLTKEALTKMVKEVIKEQMEEIKNPAASMVSLLRQASTQLMDVAELVDQASEYIYDPSQDVRFKQEEILNKKRDQINLLAAQLEKLADKL